MNSLRVSEFMSRHVRGCRNAKHQLFQIAAYPQNSVMEIAKIMKDIQVESIPVLFSPWNKKLVGVIEFNKIQVLLKDAN